MFSLVWSLGANTDEDGRHTFDAVLRQLLKGEAAAELIPYITAPEVCISWSISILRHLSHLTHHETLCYLNTIMADNSLGDNGLSVCRLAESPRASFG
jgi:hypothetical protein